MKFLLLIVLWMAFFLDAHYLFGYTRDIATLTIGFLFGLWFAEFGKDYPPFNMTN